MNKKVQNLYVYLYSLWHSAEQKLHFVIIIKTL